MARLLWSSDRETGDSSTATRSNRDRDLISTDEHLTDDILDGLWTWLFDATKDGVDPQLVFVKIINSARKPYVDFLRRLHATPTDSADTFVNNQRVIDEQAQQLKAAQATINTINEHANQLRAVQATIDEKTNQLKTAQATIDEKTNQLRTAQATIDEKTNQLEAAQDIIKDLRNEKDQLDSKIKTLTGTNPISPGPPTPAALRVAIKSTQFDKQYIRMDGTGIKSFITGGGGEVGFQKCIAGHEIFELIRHPEKNIVSFKATSFVNIYLRADAKGLSKGDTPDSGGGLVNCQYGCGDLEKFRLLPVGNQGRVAIEPLTFPGRFLRESGNWSNGVDLQGKLGAWGEFYLVIVL